MDIIECEQLMADTVFNRMTNRKLMKMTNGSDNYVHELINLLLGRLDAISMFLSTPSRRLKSLQTTRQTSLAVRPSIRHEAFQLAE